MSGKYFTKPDPEQSDRVPPGQYLANGFPVLTYRSTPQIDTKDWRFRVWGLVKEKTFSWEDFVSLPKRQFTADFHCVTRWSKLDVKWGGIGVIDFMEQIEVDPQAVHIMQHCYGDYTTNISLEDFLRPENFFAYELFDEPLPIPHGGPLRLVVPHLYAWKSAKWINGLEFLGKEKLGFWEQNGYHRRGEPWSEERFSD